MAQAVASDVGARRGLAGNRYVLAGAVVYLMEWVAIIGSGLAGVTSTATVDESVEGLLDSYTGHADAVAFMAGWFALCLLGRILIFIGIRASLTDSGLRGSPLMDLAVAAATVSVTLEIATYGIASAAAGLADPEDPAAMLLLDRAAGWLNMTIAGGLGVAVVASAWCMHRSGLFSTPLNVLGIVSGLGLCLAQLSISPSLSTLFAVLGWSPLLFWVWMLWAGVLLWRRTPRTDRGALAPRESD